MSATIGLIQICDDASGQRGQAIYLYHALSRTPVEALDFGFPDAYSLQRPSPLSDMFLRGECATHHAADVVCR